MSSAPKVGHVLEISGLRAGVSGKEILRGIDLTVRSGEVHAVMGPNGSGKSTLAHVLMGRPGYEVLGGSVTLDGADLLSLEPWQRAQAGLFLALQYPTEVPGVSLHALLESAARAGGRDAAAVDADIRAEAQRLVLDPRLIDRPLNVDLSGGEKKKNETLQLGVLRPSIAVLDELDSGLDIDALRACARRVEAATNDVGLGVLAITHYSRLLHELRADRVHVLAKGQIVRSGGPELSEEVEDRGYTGMLGAELAGEDDEGQPVSIRPAIEDPLGAGRRRPVRRPPRLTPALQLAQPQRFRRPAGLAAEGGQPLAVGWPAASLEHVGQHALRERHPRAGLEGTMAAQRHQHVALGVGPVARHRSQPAQMERGHAGERAVADATRQVGMRGEQGPDRIDQCGIAEVGGDERQDTEGVRPLVPWGRGRRPATRSRAMSRAPSPSPRTRSSRAASAGRIRPVRCIRVGDDGCRRAQHPGQDRAMPPGHDGRGRRPVEDVAGAGGGLDRDQRVVEVACRRRLRGLVLRRQGRCDPIVGLGRGFLDRPEGGPGRLVVAGQRRCHGALVGGHDGRGGVTGCVGEDGQVVGEGDSLVEVIGSAQPVQPPAQGMQGIGGRPRARGAGERHCTGQQPRMHEPAVLVGRPERAQGRFHQGAGIGPQLRTFRTAVGKRQARRGRARRTGRAAGRPWPPR